MSVNVMSLKLKNEKKESKCFIFYCCCLNKKMQKLFETFQKYETQRYIEKWRQNELTDADKQNEVFTLLFTQK